VGEYPIVVSDTVRTLGTYYTGLTTNGSQYTLSGIFTGVNYQHPVPNAAFWDGAFDGTFNYSVEFNHGGVYRFNPDWTNPVMIFSTSSDYLGITYDAANNTLWIAKFHTGLVEHRTLTGTLLSSFTVPFTGVSCLALDPVDRTLWMGSQNNQGTFYQYTQAGVQVRTRTYTNLRSQNTLGGEFPFVVGPTPTPTPTPSPTVTPTPTPSPTAIPSPSPNGAVTVSISVSPGQVTEGGDATFRVSSDKTLSQAITVAYSMSGKATQGGDYSLSGTPGQIIIPAGAAFANVTLHANVDHVSEKTESAIMTLSKSAAYKLSKTKKATVSILNAP
jgi:hypothetical protein